MTILAPDLLYRDGAFQEGVGVRCDPGAGTIDAVGPTEALSADAGGRDAVVRLPGRALLPGFVNAHSHAFQRLIRGRTQWRPAVGPSDFWSWRDAMYTAALGLTPEQVQQVSRYCFLEMLRAGYTAVGEFHYLHRDRDGRAYADPNELAKRVLAAAEEAGIRIVLLNVCYAAGGIGAPLADEQRRFGTPSLDGYLAETDSLLDSVTRPESSVGIAPHSIRAVPPDWLARLHERAVGGNLPFHMHVSEQPAEVRACEAAYGVPPVELLAQRGVLDARLTAVHATHLTDGEVALLGGAGATVCACPTTERDLGDGFLRGRDLLAAGAAIALGSDSQTVIDPFEEMRLVEYHERLQRLQRVVLGRERDGRIEVAPTLLEMGTRAGARSLRLDAGAIEPGRLADLVAIDLAHPALAGWDPARLPALLALSAPAAVVDDVWVGGRRVLEAGRHPLEDEARAAFDAVAAGAG